MADDYNTLTEVARDALIYDDPRLPLKAVAAGIGKPYATLTRELNPDDDGAKLGYMLLRKDDVHPDQPSWPLEHAQDTQHLGEMARLMAAGAAPEEVQRLGARAIQDIEETVVRYAKDHDAGHVATVGRQ